MQCIKYSFLKNATKFKQIAKDQSPSAVVSNGCNAGFTSTFSVGGVGVPGVDGAGGRVGVPGA